MKLEINRKIKHRIYRNSWRLNSACLKQCWALNKSWEKLNSFLDSSENTTFHKLWYMIKILILKKYIAVTAYIEKSENYQASNSFIKRTMHFCHQTNA